ncbi:hypothetical protein E2C01_057676 [Portunus trituberculatus]|uniref:Uncharacterized protein n=1 Tax=Portunus trituberculatus TaxID=210409 RepID=A0A5B7H2M2_PORTR|nr:hypothetical protein [Portunus trituberculatus]
MYLLTMRAETTLSRATVDITVLYLTSVSALARRLVSLRNIFSRGSGRRQPIIMNTAREKECVMRGSCTREPYNTTTVILLSPQGGSGWACHSPGCLRAALSWLLGWTQGGRKKGLKGGKERNKRAVSLTRTYDNRSPKSVRKSGEYEPVNSPSLAACGVK